MGADILSKYFKLSGTQTAQFEKLQSLYELWNARINVISRKDIEALYERHVLHSLAIYKFSAFQPGSRILDIGTGGGFPGIPLAIMQPEVTFFLTDSIGKKIKVVNEVAAAIGLNNVTALHIRSEKAEGKFDFAVSRAVAQLREVNAWCKGKISTTHVNAIPNGLICLKGGDLREELKDAGCKAQLFDLKEYFDTEYFETKKLVYVPYH